MGAFRLRNYYTPIAFSMVLDTDLQAMGFLMGLSVHVFFTSD